MPSSQKPTRNTTGDAAGRTKPKQKTNQPQLEKPAAQAEAEAETTETEPTAASARKSGATAPTAPKTSERKTGTPAATARERKPAPPSAGTGTRERKLTPQQQAHLARIKRRQLNERLGLGLGALILIVIIAVVIRQAVIKSQQDAQAAATSTRQAVLHTMATGTAGAKATATENAFAPGTLPTVTGTTVTTKDGLQYIDITAGTGATVKVGDTINAKYIGWLQATGLKFDSSYDDNKGDKPTQFQLVVADPNNPGAGGLIKGFVEGIAGMKVGGTRRLIIPPALGYGDQAQGPIPANSTLIFDVTIVSIGTDTATATPGS